MLPLKVYHSTKNSYATKYNYGSVGCSICECKYDTHQMIQMNWQYKCGRKNYGLATRQTPRQRL